MFSQDLQKQRSSELTTTVQSKCANMNTLRQCLQHLTELDAAFILGSNGEMKLVVHMVIDEHDERGFATQGHGGHAYNVGVQESSLAFSLWCWTLPDDQPGAFQELAHLTWTE